ncbi:streptophobe family protein [Streptomyces sp. NPDC002054]|uniref:streptophobe family protein n=1 Tax=Streptomyces sp. NPDC002054 TaxID=3154663 RepID=UPI0033303EED
MGRIRWGEVVLSAVAAVGWSVMTMAVVAALGLRLLGADAAGGSLGAMTAAVVVLAVGGSVTPSGEVSALGIDAASAETALDVTPLGVSLAGALVLARVVLRSLPVGVGVRGAELAARAGAVAVLFVATVGGLGWAGRDVVTLDGSVLPAGTLPVRPSGPPRVEVPGLGDIGGLLPDGIGDRLGDRIGDRIGDLVETRAKVGFSVDSGPTLVAAAIWVAVVLVVALVVSRRGPAVLAGVRPAVSAVVAMLLVAVAAGLAAGLWAALGEEHPRQGLGAALLGAPNGAWVGVLLGLCVPFEGSATGAPARVLPHPVGELLSVSAREPVTVARLAEYDGRVWLLVPAAALLLLWAGAVTAVRSPGRGVPACAARLGAVTGVVCAGLAWLTGFSASASLAVLGVDTVGAGVELRGSVGAAGLLGVVWGVGGGLGGGMLARLPWPAAGGPGPGPRPGPGPGPRAGPGPGPYRPSSGYGPGPGRNPYRDPDVSWDVTVTARPRPKPPPRRRPPFTPPPPPGPPPPL